MEVLLVPADPDQPDGPEVVHKTATLPGERERLLHEAEVLRAAASRGVRGLAEVVVPPPAEAAEPTLVTAAVPGPSLAVADPLPVVEVAGVAAEVARLLAGIHEAGLVHGAVEPGHVVLDGAGGAILVGLGRGGRAGAPRPAGAGGGNDERLDPATDVAGWGALVAHLLDWSAAGTEEPLAALRQAIAARPARRRRSAAGRAPTRAADEHRRVLAALADQAQHPDPAHRPTARSLAAAVEHRVPGARVPGAASPAAPPPPRHAGLVDRLAGHLGAPPAPQPAVDGQRPAAPGATATGQAAATEPEPAPQPAPAGTAAAGPARHPRPRPAAVRLTPRRGAALAAVGALAVAAALAVTTRPPPPTPAALAPPAPGSCPPAAPPAADADGDGCEETVRWADGVLQAGVARFAPGRPADAWAVGDWDCDGRRTAALLHQGTLALFDAWPAPGGELQSRPVTVPGAQGVTVVAGADGCDRLALARPGGADVLVDPRLLP